MSARSSGRDLRGIGEASLDGPLVLVIWYVWSFDWVVCPRVRHAPLNLLIDIDGHSWHEKWNS